MEHIDQTQRVDMYAPKSSSRMLRWMMWMLLFITALLMGAVLLSQPRAKTYVQSSLDRFETMMASFKSGEPEPAVDLAAPIEITDITALEPISEADIASPQKPNVLSMPTSRVPVNRLGLSSED